MSDARLEPIAGGITNALHKVTPETAVYREGGPEPVVLRVFGRGTEAFLDRDTENAALAELNACGFGARCLGVFKNGRLEARVEHAGPRREERAAHGERVRAEHGRVSVCGGGVGRSDCANIPERGRGDATRVGTYLGRGPCPREERTTGVTCPDDDGERFADHPRIVATQCTRTARADTADEVTTG